MPYRASSKLFVLLAAAMFLQVWAGCDLLGASGKKNAPSIPEGAVLAASMTGNEPGLWRFDPESLKRTGVFHNPQSAVYGMAFSPDGETLYATWQVGSALEEPPPPRIVLARLDTKTWQVAERETMSAPTTAGGPYLIYDSTQARLVAYGGSRGIVEFYDPTTLDRTGTVSLAPEALAPEDSNALAIDEAVLAPQRDVIYFDSHSTFEPGSEVVHQVQVFDLSEEKVTERLLLTEDPALQRSAVSDLALSPNERFLYATTYLSPGGPGRFFMVDLESGEPVFEGSAGGYSSLAVHPGGRYVYVDCPAGGRRELVPTNQILRFDREAREMEVFIDGGKKLGLPHEGLVADEITMLPGGEAFIIRNPWPALTSDHSTSDTTSLDSPTLLQIDVETRKVYATYNLPRRNDGYVQAGVFKLSSRTVRFDP